MHKTLTNIFSALISGFACPSESFHFIGHSEIWLLLFQHSEASVPKLKPIQAFVRELRTCKASPSCTTHSHTFVFQHCCALNKNNNVMHSWLNHIRTMVALQQQTSRNVAAHLHQRSRQSPRPSLTLTRDDLGQVSRPCTQQLSGVRSTNLLLQKDFFVLPVLQNGWNMCIYRSPTIRLKTPRAFWRTTTVRTDHILRTGH